MIKIREDWPATCLYDCKELNKEFTRTLQLPTTFREGLYVFPEKRALIWSHGQIRAQKPEKTCSSPEKVWVIGRFGRAASKTQPHLILKLRDWTIGWCPKMSMFNWHFRGLISTVSSSFTRKAHRTTLENTMQNDQLEHRRERQTVKYLEHRVFSLMERRRSILKVFHSERRTGTPRCSLKVQTKNTRETYILE